MKHVEAHNPLPTRTTFYDIQIFVVYRIIIFNLSMNVHAIFKSFFSVGTIARNGTCYSSTECRDKSGQASGGCASGYVHY